MRAMSFASCSEVGSVPPIGAASPSKESRYRGDSGFTGNQSLRQIFRVALPTREHGYKVVPPVQDYHHQVAQNEQNQRAQNAKMPHPCPVKTSHQRSESRKLNRIKEYDSCEERNRTEQHCRRIGHFLHGVVGLRLQWLASEEKIMARHGPDS